MPTTPTTTNGLAAYDAAAREAAQGPHAHDHDIVREIATEARDWYNAQYAPTPDAIEEQIIDRYTPHELITVTLTITAYEATQLVRSRLESADATADAQRAYTNSLTSTITHRRRRTP